MDGAIEEGVRQCTVSQRQNSPKVFLHPWQWPTRPMQRVHIDFCESEKCHFLILIDSHSKWVRVKPMSSTTAERKTDELRLIFCQLSLPVTIVSDNAPQFTSKEFKNFEARNGIKHVLVAPYHTASNGAAERTVPPVEEALTK